jgi:hypothetical protein
MGNNTPIFWMLDPGFLAFVAVVAAGYGLVRLIAYIRGR